MNKKYETDSVNKKRGDKLKIKYVGTSNKLKKKLERIGDADEKELLLRKEVEKIMHAEKLPDNWYPVIHRFLTENDVAKLIPPLDDFHIKFDSVKGELCIRIYKTTSFENLDKLRKDIKVFQKLLPDVSKPKKIDSKYLDLRDKRKKNRIKSREALDEKDFQKKFVRKKGKEVYDVNTVDKGISRLNKILKE